MYSKEEEAIHFVFKAFKNQKRIKEDICLAFHSVSVGYMLKHLGCDEKTVLIGFLHDIIEDTKYNYDNILAMFGKDIADGVLKVSENISIFDWKKRKEEFFERLETYEENILIVELADKLQNLLSDYHLFEKNGKESLATLKTTYDNNKWYYLRMKKIFNDKISNNILLERYNEITNIYFE